MNSERTNQSLLRQREDRRKRTLEMSIIGRQLAGPRFEVYGDWRDDPAQLETEVYYLLR